MTAANPKREALRVLARDQRADRPGRRGWIALGLLLAAGAGTGVWLLVPRGAPPAVLEVRALVDEQIADLQRVARNEKPLPYDSAGFGTVLERVRRLPPEQRRAAGREVGRLFAAREAAEIDSYFAMPPALRQAELDRRIAAEEARRAARDAERARREAERTAREQVAPPPSATATAAGQRAPAPPGGPAPGGRRGSTEESRNERFKRMIDASTPDGRARRTEYRRALAERRARLGLTSGRGW